MNVFVMLHTDSICGEAVFRFRGLPGLLRKSVRVWNSYFWKTKSV